MPPSQRTRVAFTRLPRQYASFGNHRVAYATVGRGPALLLLHGLGGTADFMQPLIAPLAEQFTILCPDLLGFGYSDKPRGPYDLARHTGAMLAVVRAAGSPEFSAVVGHSVGGVVAMALIAGGLVAAERLALAAAPYLSPRFPVRQELVTQPYFQQLLANRALARLDDAFFRRVLWPLARFVQTPDYLQGGRAGLLDYSVDSYYGTAEELLLRANLDPLVARLPAIPTLLLYGRDDRTVPHINGERLHAALPWSSLVETIGGHYGIISAGLATLVEWLKQPAPHP